MLNMLLNILTLEKLEGKRTCLYSVSAALYFPCFKYAEACWKRDGEFKTVLSCEERRLKTENPLRTVFN